MQRGGGFLAAVFLQALLHTVRLFCSFFPVSSTRGCGFHVGGVSVCSILTGGFTRCLACFFVSRVRQTIKL